MARIPRLLLQGESATYHVISRSALPGFAMGEVEKDYLLALLRRLSRVYLVEVLGFCLMGSHAHVVVRMHPGEGVDDDEMRRRYLISRGRESVPELLDGQIPWLREKWASLSEFVKGLTIPQDSGIGQRHAARRASPRRGLVKSPSPAGATAPTADRASSGASVSRFRRRTESDSRRLPGGRAPRGGASRA